MKKRIYSHVSTVICSLLIAMPIFMQASFFNPQFIGEFCTETAATFILSYQALQSTADGIYTIACEEHIIKDCTNVTPEVSDFIINEWEKVSSKKIDIKIYPACSPEFPIATMYKHIVLAQCVADEISTALKTNNQDILNKWCAVIQHEAAHIQNNDLPWRLAIDLSAFLINRFLYMYYANKILPPRVSSWGEYQFMKLDGALCILLITESLRMAIYRYQEKRADMHIANDIKLLTGFKHFCNDYETLTFKNYVAIDPTYERYPLIYKINRWLINFFEEHPLPSARIKKIDERIAALQKTGNHNAVAQPTN